jgi:hypothetical protein
MLIRNGLKLDSINRCLVVHKLNNLYYILYKTLMCCAFGMGRLGPQNLKKSPEFPFVKESRPGYSSFDSADRASVKNIIAGNPLDFYDFQTVGIL